MTALAWMLADVSPWGPFPHAVEVLVWLLPVAGLVLGLWLGARARRCRSDAADKSRRDDE